MDQQPMGTGPGRRHRCSAIFRALSQPMEMYIELWKRKREKDSRIHSERLRADPEREIERDSACTRDLRLALWIYSLIRPT